MLGLDMLGEEDVLTEPEVLMPAILYRHQFCSSFLFNDDAMSAAESNSSNDFVGFIGRKAVHARIPRTTCKSLKITSTEEERHASLDDGRRFQRNDSGDGVHMVDCH